MEVELRKVRNFGQHVKVEWLIQMLINVGDHSMHAAFVFGAAVSRNHMLFKSKQACYAHARFNPIPYVPPFTATASQRCATDKEFELKSLNKINILIDNGWIRQRSRCGG